MTNLLAALDAAGRALFDAAGLPDGWAYSFTDASTGAIAGLRAYAEGPSGMTLVIRSEPGEGNLYGPYSAALRRNGEPAGECAASLPQLAATIRKMIAMQTPGGAE